MVQLLGLGVSSHAEGVNPWMLADNKCNWISELAIFRGRTVVDSLTRQQRCLVKFFFWLGSEVLNAITIMTI